MPAPTLSSGTSPARPFTPIIDAEVARRAEGFVVICGHAESGAQLFVELAEFLELFHVDGELLAFVGDQKFLIARVPERGELALQHDAGNLSHLKTAFLAFAKLGAAVVFLNADHAAGISHQKAFRGERFDARLVEQFVDVPHGVVSIGKLRGGCKGMVGRVDSRLR